MHRCLLLRMFGKDTEVLPLCGTTSGLGEGDVEMRPKHSALTK